MNMAIRIPRICPNCYRGTDDGNCSLCAVIRVMPEQFAQKQVEKRKHIASLERGIQDCHCAFCVRHLIHEVLEYGAQLPLTTKVRCEQERSSAAHMRDQLRETAKEWL